GYRDVLRDGVDGLLVPRADATRLAEALRDLALDPARRARLAAGAAERAERYAWPVVAGEVLRAYEDAIALPAPATRAARAAVRAGRAPADGGAPVAPRRLPSLEPALRSERSRGRQALRRGAIALAGVAGAGLSALALQRIGLDRIGQSLLASRPVWVLVALGLMCASMIVRAVAWHEILRAALPKARVRLADAMQGTFIGVLMSATLPARLGEPSRALIVARRTGRPREHLPTVVGTIVSQTLLNILALVVLGLVMFATSRFFDHRHGALIAFAVTPLAILAAVLLAPALLRGGLPSRSRRVQAAVRKVRHAAYQVRAGLRVFRRPREGSLAVIAQLSAWAVQLLSCFVLLAALGLDDRAGLGAAAAVLFAVNVTAAIPATPSNLGVFQAACVAVLSGAYGVSYADALAYGIILQAVEIATAIVMGAPALLKEGLSWRDVRLRALHTTPVRLAPLPKDAARAEA
ncbi:MAG TPA: lysylphosphatidylglycerol synthase domain-containing protein, partial [Solirubrobacteraceae bacterium]|nr:lysylphosphatidylglycerol synthase domain-containing protein [Solirubrobacteraceae bacterium]